MRFAGTLSTPAPHESVVAGPQHTTLAYEAAVRSLVLLRNEPVDDAPVLPLPHEASLAVIGTQAAGHALGDRGSSRVTPPRVVSLLDGLAMAHEGTVSHHPGDDIEAAATAAAAADIAVVMVGYDHEDEGEYVGLEGTAHLQGLFPPQQPDTRELLSAAFEKVARHAGERSMGRGGDRSSLRLRPHDEELIEAVAAANPRTVVLVVSGSAVVMPWAHRTAATMMVWYPGQEGGRAIADVLTGHRLPTGRLPLTIPHSESHLPAFDPAATEVVYDRWHGYTKLHRDGEAAHFPFGFGLAYTSFRIESLEVRGGTAWATVVNTGERAGSHLVQLYGGSVHSPADGRAEWLLCGFAHTPVMGPGQRVVVEVALDPWALRRWDPVAQRLQPPTGEHRISARSHADHHDAPTVVHRFS